VGCLARTQRGLAGADHGATRRGVKGNSSADRARLPQKRRWNPAICRPTPCEQERGGSGE
jgi:hypothetical protein